MRIVRGANVKAYLIANITVTDPTRFREYREQVTHVIAKFGGRFLVREGAVHPLEGNLGLHSFVVVEFPSMEAARQFYDSAEYAPLLKLRTESSHSSLAIVEGYQPA